MRNKIRFRLGDLSGPEGNVFAVMGRWAYAAKKAGWTTEEIEEVISDAQSGDYEQALDVMQNVCLGEPNVTSTS